MEQLTYEQVMSLARRRVTGQAVNKSWQYSAMAHGISVTVTCVEIAGDYETTAYAIINNVPAFIYRNSHFVGWQPTEWLSMLALQGVDKFE